LLEVGCLKMQKHRDTRQYTETAGGLQNEPVVLCQHNRPASSEHLPEEYYKRFFKKSTFESYSWLSTGRDKKISIWPCI